ncbi:MAG: hypothetical protein COB07_02090 [Sulfurovum sp.]|nr:MAG: hypothetical protein COB07_02090 [Sulfurovum sp.]
MKQLFLTSIFIAFFISLLDADTIDVRIASNSDDAVEEINTGNVYTNEDQLDIVVYSTDTLQKVGLRFANLQIPNGATISNAYIQFRARRDEIGQTDITLVGENNSNPLTYAGSSSNITGRVETSAFADWLNVPEWTSGQDYQTADITAIVQELVDLGTWQAGNAMAIMMKPYNENCNDGECSRVAVSFDRNPATAPLLHIVFNELPTAPKMGDVPDSEAVVDLPFTLNVSDYVTLTDGDPVLTYSLTGTLPSGLEFDTATGIINGIPSVSETQNLSVTATDKDGTSLSDSFTITVTNTLIVEYRMDECFWLGSAYSDVRDSSINAHDTISFNNTAITTGIINTSALFSTDQDQMQTEDSSVGNTNGALSVSFWIKLDQQLGKWAHVLTKTKIYNWNDGWGFVNPDSSAGDKLRFYIGKYNSNNQFIDTTLTVSDGWVHIAATYDGNSMQLYKNGVEAGSIINAGLSISSADPIKMAFDDIRDATLKGNLDEVKVWKSGLSANEIKWIFDNELLKKNYNGTDRNQVTCGSNIVGGSWEMIGIPAESRSVAIGVQEVFGDDFVGASYDSSDENAWVLWKREYHENDNLSDWVKVDYINNEPIVLGKGYWLGSAVAVDWDVDGLEDVEYDSSYNGTADCVSNRCVEIDLRSVSTDGSDGSGSKRYNLSGFVGKTPINWRDCRFIVSDLDGSNIEVLTPEEAETAGYASRTISLWPGGQGTGENGSIITTDYKECTDTTPGGCQLTPYHGAWIKVFIPTLTKTVKLLIPQE